MNIIKFILIIETTIPDENTFTCVDVTYHISRKFLSPTLTTEMTTDRKILGPSQICRAAYQRWVLTCFMWRKSWLLPFKGQFPDWPLFRKIYRLFGTTS